MGKRWAWPLLVALGLAFVGVFGWGVVFASDPSDGAPGPAAAPARTPDAPRASSGAGDPTAAPDPASSAAPEAKARPRTAVRAVYIGDSLAMENQKVLGDRIAESGRASLRSAPYSGTTLCDYLEGGGGRSLVPAQDKAAALVRTVRPSVLILQFWGNSWGYTPCMGNIASGTPEYYARYAADAKELTRQISAAADNAGIARPKLVWVLQPPDAFRPDRIRRVNSLYAAQAAATGDLVSDAGRAVSAPGARYTWTRQLPCNAFEKAHPAYCTAPERDGGTTDLHRTDDALHFCLAPTTSTPKPCPVRSPGIVRYTQVIAATVDDYLRDR